MADMARIEPGPGQESVWDYPRPPVLSPAPAPVRVLHGDLVVAESDRAVRVLETSQAPAFYLPPDDVDFEHLRPSAHHTYCEWKGQADYFDVVGLGVAAMAAWSYPEPVERFAELAGYVSFYPDKVTCWVGDEQATAMPGGFYGGWVTSMIVGPFKGGPGTQHW